MLIAQNPAPRLQYLLEFVLGFAYPSIRGRTGLTKGLAIFVTMAASGLCLTLLPDPQASGAFTAAVLQTAQWLAFGLIIGLTADLRHLRMAGLGWRNLGDLHNLTALAASASTLALAVTTATVTALGTSAVGIAIERMLPAPAATSTPASK